MNKRVKKLWIKALRSGEYEQATGALRINNTYCCLGVLCDLYRKQEHKGRWLRESADTFQFLRTNSVLPDTVVEWAGLPDENPTVRRTDNLASLNDGGKSFKQLANVIEKHL